MSDKLIQLIHLIQLLPHIRMCCEAAGRDAANMSTKPAVLIPGMQDLLNHAPKPTDLETIIDWVTLLHAMALQVFSVTDIEIYTASVEVLFKTNAKLFCDQWDKITPEVVAHDVRTWLVKFGLGAESAHRTMFALSAYFTHLYLKVYDELSSSSAL